MGDIYTAGKITTPQFGTVQPFTQDNVNRVKTAGKELSDKGEKTIQEAKDVYAKQLNIIAQGSLGSLSNDPKLSSNPEAMAGEIDKVVGKISSEIQDDDTKINFLMNMELKKQSYINQAQANFNKEQEERRKQAYYNSIYGAMDSISMSLSNGLRGTGNVDDFINAVNSQNMIKQSLESMNNNGKPMFSITQQQQMRRDADKVVLDGVKQTIDGMTEDEANEFYEKVKNNTFSVGKIKDKDVMLQDVIGDRTYADVKRYAMNRRLQDLSLIKKQAEIDGRQTKIDFELNPTEANYEAVKKANPLMSENEKDQIETIWKASPNYEATTKFIDYEQAKGKINELSAITDEKELEKASLDYVAKLTRSNVGGTLSVEDLQSLKEEVRGVLLDPEMRKIRALTAYKYRQNTIWDGFLARTAPWTDAWHKESEREAQQSIMRKEAGARIGQKIAYRELQQRAELILRDYNKARDAIMADGSLSTSEKINKINELDDNTNKELVYLRNPDVKGKEIGAIIQRNGMLYTYEGMTNNDIILKIVK